MIIYVYTTLSNKIPDVHVNLVNISAVPDCPSFQSNLMTPDQTVWHKNLSLF